MKDYYAILGVREAASQAEIKRAYRLLAIKYHPDKNPSQEAENLFKEINEAYDVLSDLNKKFFYDQRRYNPLHDLVTEQPTPTPRDPRYKRNSSRPKREKPADYVLMEKCNKYVLWMNIAGVVMSSLFFIDYVIPYKRTEENVSRIYVVLNARSRHVAYHVIDTQSGKKLKIYKPIPGLVDQFELHSSRIYSMPMRIITKQASVPLAHMYGHMTFMPLWVLLMAGIGIAMRKKVVAAFNCGVVTALLIIITLVLIY